jgi:hypothetical protein
MVHGALSYLPDTLMRHVTLHHCRHCLPLALELEAHLAACPTLEHRYHLCSVSALKLLVYETLSKLRPARCFSFANTSAYQDEYADAC